MAQTPVSKGLVRSRADKLMLIPGGNDAPRTAAAPAHGYATAGATALKEEPAVYGEAQMSKLGFAAPAAQPSQSERRAEAIMKGYVGDSCGECGNFTLVRNGNCLKCNTCGSTTGCS